ncbi:hypothetical protein BVC80_8233g5 [Macleaya cordata]|uniref:Uncharacterized protein n=1 Tax=Macleaya cordata TaxID=56857 RepID=A0A200QAH6_MACCD|nr:hypothetical protein BVC80_8233g5 [Macleaya cordata]
MSDVTGMTSRTVEGEEQAEAPREEEPQLQQEGVPTAVGVPPTAPQDQSSTQTETSTVFVPRRSSRTPKPNPNSGVEVHLTPSGRLLVGGALLKTPAVSF